MENKYFYCYSVKMKDFLKSTGLFYVDRGVNKRSGFPYFIFEKGEKLDRGIQMWNEVKGSFN